jgi:dihydrofolate reductase
MKNVSMIAAVGKNLEIGKDNQLLWPIKEDLQFFKEQTMGKPIVMGMGTFESMGKRILPGRQSVILTRKNRDLDEKIIVVHSKEELLKFIEDYKDEVMIIGGATVYDQMMEYAEKLILTEIDATREDADAYFPTFNKDEWDSEVLSSHEIVKCNEYTLKYKHLVYKRK